ncbi:hypothetical protein BCEN4_1020007 [Burkholderia cenocepacia]|nr:hypothetical protein BCEN4_1020007 [Burkholderia cenocepacia]
MTKPGRTIRRTRTMKPKGAARNGAALGSLPRGGEGRGRAEARRGMKRFDAAARGRRDEHTWQRAGRELDSTPKGSDGQW